MFDIKVILSHWFCEKVCLLFFGRVWVGLTSILYMFCRIYQWSHLALGILCFWFVCFLFCIQQFNYNVSGMDLFEYILLVHCDSWIYGFMSSSNLGSFQPLFLLFFFLPIPQSPLLLGLTLCVFLCCWWCPLSPLASIHFSSFFFSFQSSDWIISNALSWISLIFFFILPLKIYHWISIINFSFQYLSKRIHIPWFFITKMGKSNDRGSPEIIIHSNKQHEGQIFFSLK